MDPAEWVTMREAADLLAPAGVDRETTRRLLLAGLGGETIRRGNGTLHRRARVEELGRRPVVERPADLRGCRSTFVARLRTHPVLSVEERWESARGPWRLSALGGVRLRVDVERDGFVPLVATLGGFVVLGAEIVDVVPVGHARSDRPVRRLLTIRPAGVWYDAWRGHRLQSPGRHHWWVWPDGLWSPAATRTGTPDATEATAAHRPAGD